VENPVHTSLVGNPALSVRAVQRQLAALLPEAHPAGAGERTLEIAGQGMDAPRLISATVMERGPLRAHRVFGAPATQFRAFLDGTQRSEVAMYVGHVPIVLGHTAAVVRERRNRRMHTWDTPLAETRLYCPRAIVGETTWSCLRGAFGTVLVDTTDGEAEVTSHPLALRDAAVHRVQAHRELLEQRLAERWCKQERDPIFIDGGISGNEAVAVSGCTVGVVKSHMTLYVDADGLGVLSSLAHGQRSSVLRITSRKRTAVASWYLRLRDATGHDPMWGLVRVEVAQPAPDAADRIGARADEVSRWILAEVSPLALPDARWDKMVYGIRDCEEYLRAIQ
jgi:hypothetical protein